MCQETFVKWVQVFDANLVRFLVDFSVKMFHLLKVGFLGQEVLCIMEYLYARASTSEERQNLLRQIKFGELHGVKPENMFKEYISGSKDKRPELDRLLSVVKEGDTIYCSSIDRLTRSLKHFITLIDLAKEKKIKLVLGDFEVDCRGELSALMQGQLLMLSMVSEIMRLMIVESVKDGLRAARSEGRVGGQPKLTRERIYNKNHDVAKYYIDYIENRINFTEFCRLCVISRNTGYRYLKVLRES